MFGKSKAKPLVGLDIGSSSVKAVELRKKGADYVLVNIGGPEPFEQDTVVDGSIMNAQHVSEKIEKIFSENKMKTKDVATAVSGHSVIVKRITVNAATEEEVANAIEYEAQQHIPFDIADVYKDYQSLGPGAGGGFDVMLVAVKREKIANHTSVLNMAGKNAVVADIDAFALQNAFELNYSSSIDQMTALLNIGASIMNINICRSGVPLFTRDVSVGGNQYTDTLQKELDLSFEDAEKLKKGEEIANVSPDSKAPHLRSVSEILLLEIQKTFDFFKQTASNESIQQVYVAGGTAKVEGLVDLLKEEFSLPVEVLNPFKSINTANVDQNYINEIAPRMAVAVGLALRSFDNV